MLARITRLVLLAAVFGAALHDAPAQTGTYTTQPYRPNNVRITGGTISGVAITSPSLGVTGLVRGNGSSAISAYGGTSCTNQLVRALSSAGSATCASVTSADVSASTGSGSFVLATSPTLTTPTLGAASATSINGTSIPASKTLVVTTDTLAAHAATTSAQLSGVISDETGSGALVFATSPTLTTPNIGAATATQLVVSTSASPAAGDACTAGRIVWDTGFIYVCTASGAWKRAALTGSY
jgi:hypothetical protein